MFTDRVRGTASAWTIGISKDSRRLFKWDAMFLEVGNGLRNVPRKHIHVYTLIRTRSQGLRSEACLLGWSGLSRLSGLFGLWGRGREERDWRETRDAGLGYLVCFVCLVSLVYLTREPDRPKQPNEQTDRPADFS